MGLRYKQPALLFSIGKFSVLVFLLPQFMIISYEIIIFVEH